jgi:hypothetical protein
MTDKRSERTMRAERLAFPGGAAEAAHRDAERSRGKRQVRDGENELAKGVRLAGGE